MDKYKSVINPSDSLVSAIIEDGYKLHSVTNYDGRLVYHFVWDYDKSTEIGFFTGEVAKLNGGYNIFESNEDE